MNAIMIYYLYANAPAGLGFDKADAAQLISLYATVVGMTTIIGSYVCDRILGCRRSLLVARVTGFIGSSGGGAKPFPVAEEEMENILRRLGMSERKVQVDFEVGDRVRILSGAFANVEGTVEELHDDEQTAVVLTILFGRETPTEIPYGDLEKVEL